MDFFIIFQKSKYFKYPEQIPIKKTPKPKSDSRHKHSRKNSLKHKHSHKKCKHLSTKTSKKSHQLMNLSFNNLNARNNDKSIVVETTGNRNYTHIIQNSYFRLNKDIIFSYVNYVFKSGSSLIMTDNIFDNNQGSVLYLEIDDFTSEASPILISNSKFINHNSVSDALFTITSDQNVGCQSKGLGNNWAYNKQLIFKDLIFNDNINTQFINIICVKVNINNITLNNNEMNSVSKGVILFEAYSFPLLTNLTSNGNMGTLIILSNTNTTTLEYHEINNHQGNYLTYNASDSSFNDNDRLI